jgi:hypothetical protein
LSRAAMKLAATVFFLGVVFLALLALASGMGEN